MKKFLLLSCAVLFALSGCKKEGANTKITSLEFKKGSYELYENDSDKNMKKELVAAPDGILDKEKIVWKVSDEEVAEMSGNFLVPIMPGDVKVTATVQNISATCNVSILPVPVESITLEDMTVALYGSSQIKCTTEPSSISLKRITFSSSDDDIAYVNSDGMVQGKGAGTATITAKVDGKEATCTVTVEKKDVAFVTVSPQSYKFSSVGETLQLTATIEPSDASIQTVKWSSDQKSVAVVDENTGLVACKGGGSATITATVDGKKATCTVSMPEFGTVTDCQNNTYKTVKIGSQWWMAENMRATKYSPNNTASKNLSITVLQAGGEMRADAPACIDASKRANWNMSSAYGQGTTDGLTDEMVGKLGYLYNWTAAVGVADGTAVSTDFTGNRQGICPDGWHVPTDDEWIKLRDFIESTESGRAGKHLKSVNGWWNGDNNYKPGEDTFGFYALPAGVYQYNWKGSNKVYTLNYTGTHTVLWTCTLDPSAKGGYAENRYMIYFYDELMYGVNLDLWTEKNNGCSVRCVKN